MTVADQLPTALENGIAAFLTEAYAQPITLVGLKRLTGGTSHETWAFDAILAGAKPTGKPTRLPFVLRRDFSKDVLDLDLTAEFALLTALYKQGIPVPKPCFCVAENSPIGTPFMISERMDGKDIRKVMAETPALTATLGQRLTRIQGAIHGIEWQALVKGTALEVSGSPAAHEVSRWSQRVLDNLVSPEPLLSYAISWLQHNLPAEVPPCLIHGDFKANNLLFDSNGQVSVIDWELAHIGDPYEDLAFTLLWTTRFDIVGGMLSRADYLNCYQQATGQAIDYPRLHYWQVFAWLKLAGIFLKGYSENASGRVEKPARIMLLRAIPWINHQLASLLTQQNTGKKVRQPFNLKSHKPTTFNSANQSGDT